MFLHRTKLFLLPTQVCFSPKGYSLSKFQTISFPPPTTQLSVWLANLHHGEGNSNPLQYSCLENPMDGGAWWAAVHGVTKSTGVLKVLSDSTFTFHFHALEKEMATHSSVLAWRISGTAEPGGLPSAGSHRVRHD